MSGIHRMRVLYTTYFDIIYPEDSAGLARLLEDRADPIYLKAKETIHADKNFRIVVVISPDSDSFSVTYSAEPYNRIVIYDAVPEEKDTIYEDMILGSFYREVLSAMGQSIKSGFWRFMSDFLGVDSLQPTSLMNLPFSFVKGISSLETDNKNVLNDSYNLQLLMQAKVDNTFPSWVDCAGSRDIYPCEELSTACGTAFAAFLQQRYGVNKYIEYWQDFGHVYFSFFTQTSVKIVYGRTRDDAWAQFKDSVPVPEVNENGIIFSENAVSAIPNENRTLPVKLVSTPYGIVTYDDLTFEARLINPETPLFGSRFLFTLNHVTKISADDTGRFLAVSYERPKYRNSRKSDKSAVYDLKHRRFVRETYDFRDACIISVDGVYAVAGVYVDDKYPEIRIYYSEEINEILYDETRNKIYDDIDDDLIYRRAFNNSMIPYSLTRGPDGYLVSLFKSGSRRFFHFINVKQKSEKTTVVNLEPLGTDEQLNNGLTSLTTISESGNTFSFNYIPRDDFAFYRTGLIETDDDLSFKSISLQTFDVSGGVYNPVFYQSDIYFISRKSSYNEIKKIPANYLRVKNYEFTEAAFDIPLYNEVDPDDIELSTDSDRYNPFRYMFKGTWFPMLPVKNMSITEGVSMFPGLGVSYMTQSDPLSNNEITVSMGFGYAKLDFQNLVNPTQESLKLLKSQMTDFSRDMVTAFYLKNTTTPVDLIMGSMFKFDWSGQYDFLTMLGTSWKLDLGLGFGTLSFDIYSQYNASTFSKDLFDSEEKENLFYWPAIFSAYRIFNFDFSVEYSNILQSLRKKWHKNFFYL